MKETSTIGFEYIAEKMHEQQLQLDSALMRSIQETPGMRGEALPYQFRSEWSVTCLLLFCFLLLSYALCSNTKSEAVYSMTHQVQAMGRLLSYLRLRVFFMVCFSFVIP